MQCNYMAGHRYRPVVVVIAVVSMLLLFCGKKRQHSPDTLSDEQRKLSSVISTGSGDTKDPVLLSGKLAAVIAAEPEDDSAGSRQASFNRKLDSAALLLSSQLFMETDPRRIISTVSNLLFNEWKISFNENRDTVRYLYPHLVVAEKQGSCVGMSLLYLLIAEKLGVPVYGVRAPGHMFVRYDNGRERYNIETLRNGEVMDDAWYRQRWSIRDTVLYSLDNLATGEVLAVVRYNLGTIFMHQRNYEKARRHLEEAGRLMADFPEAQGNLALVYDAQGHPAKGLQLLTAIRDVHPFFENIDRNIASLQLASADYADALTTYSALTSRYPETADFHYGRAVALLHLKKTEDAEKALHQTLSLQADHTGARSLLERIER